MDWVHGCIFHCFPSEICSFSPWLSVSSSSPVILAVGHLLTSPPSHHLRLLYKKFDREIAIQIQQYRYHEISGTFTLGIIPLPFLGCQLALLIASEPTTTLGRTVVCSFTVARIYNACSSTHICPSPPPSPSSSSSASSPPPPLPPPARSRPWRDRGTSTRR